MSPLTRAREDFVKARRPEKMEDLEEGTFSAGPSMARAGPEMMEAGLLKKTRTTDKSAGDPILRKRARLSALRPRGAGAPWRSPPR